MSTLHPCEDVGEQLLGERTVVGPCRRPCCPLVHAACAHPHLNRVSTFVVPQTKGSECSLQRVFWFPPRHDKAEHIQLATSRLYLAIGARMAITNSSTPALCKMPSMQCEHSLIS